MNDDLTEMYTKEVIDKNLSGRRLLVWDSFKCHISPRAKKLLLGRNVDMAVAQSSFNRLTSVGTNHLKTDFANSTTNGWRTVKNLYEEWQHEGTPPLDLICKWIVDAWAGVSTDVIKKSFQACGISLSLCGGQDNEISVFKAGRQCEAGLEMLKAAAAEEKQEFEEDPYEEEHLLADSEDKDDKIVEQDDGDISDD